MACPGAVRHAAVPLRLVEHDLASGSGPVDEGPSGVAVGLPWPVVGLPWPVVALPWP